ncbi:LysR family transcriptional regulator [Stappia sp. GBMRC 2046]|uniref:HTH-type transcriptional regulator CbbR n=1 Tax=Stappia sediminis TaxID=2692190 RepID=A0A7X3S6I3_9HYPH|nr:LysR family transcriptional regulator [Stappia sediminis]MXN63977.1 LysR family transcriptional regulator [Stappia sediminis]
MLNLTLRQFRAIIAIQRNGRIASAAKTLGLTAPAVTLQLKQMEEELGLALFDRTSDGLRPTAAGLAALECAQAIEDQLQAFSEEIEAFTGARKGTLRLGAVSTAKYFAPRLIAAFLKDHPGIKVDLQVGNRAETIEALRHHDLDIALMGRPPKDIAVRSTVFGEHPLVIIAPANHPLAGKRTISKEEIAKEAFLIRESGSGTRISLEIFFSDLPEKLDDLGTEMGSNETIKQAVMAGLGVAFISAHTIEAEMQLGRLAVLDVEGMPIRRQWFSVSRQDRSTSPSMQAFNGFLVRDGPAYLPRVPGTERTPAIIL